MAGLEAGFSPHCEVGFSLERQFLEVGLDPQLEDDFDTACQHLEAERSEVAFERHCLDFELQLAAVFVRQFLEAG